MREKVRNRALRLLDALAKAAEHRGYRVTATIPEPGRQVAKGHLTITITGHPYVAAVDELNDRVPHEPTQRELREQERFSWSRIPTHDQVPSGRLRLRILGWSSHQDTFEDTKTIDMATRLPAVLHGIEIRAAEAQEWRLAREREAANRKRDWERAREQAVDALREDHRAQVLTRQVDQWRRAQELDEYLAALRLRVDALTGVECDDGREWLEWAQAYRAQLDPLTQPISVPEDPEPTAEALEPFMRGLSPYGPDKW
jgi:hypothetical protein